MGYETEGKPTTRVSLHRIDLLAQQASIILGGSKRPTAVALDRALLIVTCGLQTTELLAKTQHHLTCEGFPGNVVIPPGELAKNQSACP